MASLHLQHCLIIWWHVYKVLRRHSERRVTRQEHEGSFLPRSNCFKRDLGVRVYDFSRSFPMWNPLFSINGRVLLPRTYDLYLGSYGRVCLPLTLRMIISPSQSLKKIVTKAQLRNIRARYEVSEFYFLGEWKTLERARVLSWQPPTCAIRLPCVGCERTFRAPRV